MSQKKRALGRGLDSLIGPATPRDVPEGRQVQELPLSEITPNINQPRSRFSDDQIQELADSIREKGVLQPLLVRKRHKGYELIAGERRFRAAKMAELKGVPCLIIEASDELSFEIALIENLQREDLNAMEEARAFRSLAEQFQLSNEEIAKRVGKNRSTVANSLRLLNLPLDVQEDLYENRLTAGHARAILSVSDTVKQRNLRNMIVAKKMSVREAESQARRMTKDKKPKPPKPQAMEAQMRSLQEAFSMKLGLPVLIRPVSDSSGKVEIPYQSLDDFEQISDFFGVDNS